MPSTVTSKTTLRKRAFYIVLESLVKKIPLLEIVSDRQDIKQNSPEVFQNTWELDATLVEFLEQIEAGREATEQLILDNVKSNSLSSIPNPDLAILLVMLTETQNGLELKVALDQGAKLADDFGGTDSSPDFVHAVIRNAAK